MQVSSELVRKGTIARIPLSNRTDEIGNKKEDSDDNNSNADGVNINQNGNGRNIKDNKPQLMLTQDGSGGDNNSNNNNELQPTLTQDRSNNGNNSGYGCQPRTKQLSGATMKHFLIDFYTYKTSAKISTFMQEKV